MSETLGDQFSETLINHMLGHLPFISIKQSPTGLMGDNEVSLNSLASICPSKDPEGGAQCFLVILESNLATSNDEDPLSLDKISDFVQSSPYASKVKLLSRMD